MEVPDNSTAQGLPMHYVAAKICRASEIGLNGNLFGGTLLSWLDEAGAAFAGYLCRTPNMVTLKMDEVLFKRPVKISHHVRIYARVIRVGTSSLTIEVEARRFDFAEELEELVCSTRMVYVKIDAQGNATAIEERLRNAMELSLGDLSRRP
jgi:acyl-CoA thioesterase YciA